MALTQSQAKITKEILIALRYYPADGVIIQGILDQLELLIIDKNLQIPKVDILPEVVNVKITKK